MASHAIGEKSQSNGVPEKCTGRRRTDKSLLLHDSTGLYRHFGVDQLTATTDHVIGVHRHKADQCRPLCVAKGTALSQRSTNKTTTLSYQLAQPQIGCGSPTVELAASHMPFFNTEHTHRLSAVWRDAQRLTTCQQARPKALAKSGTDCNLLGTLPGEAHPIDRQRLAI